MASRDARAWLNEQLEYATSRRDGTIPQNSDPVLLAIQELSTMIQQLSTAMEARFTAIMMRLDKLEEILIRDRLLEVSPGVQDETVFSPVPIVPHPPIQMVPGSVPLVIEDCPNLGCFEGKGKPIRRWWLPDYTRVLEVYDFTDAEKIAQMRPFMRDGALVTYDWLRASHPAASFADFCKHLEEEFPDVDESILELEFNCRLLRSDESVLAYGQALQALAYRAFWDFPDNVVDRLLRLQFRKGIGDLYYEYQVAIFDKDFLTMRNTVWKMEELKKFRAKQRQISDTNVSTNRKNRKNERNHSESSSVGSAIPQSERKFCSFHGSASHDSASCRALHPELRTSK